MKVIQRVDIRNFLGTESRFVDFSEKNDSILIVGENAKGKTTIMRAIYFCLTGEDAFFGSRDLDSVIRDGADEMSITMEILGNGGASLYSIEVFKAVGKALRVKIYENGELLNTSDLLTDAKEILVSLFGNPLSIRNTYFMFSSADDDFVNATNSRRLELITKSSDAFMQYETISESAKVMASRKDDEKIRLQGEYENEKLRSEDVLREKETSFAEISSIINAEPTEENIGKFLDRSENEKKKHESSIALAKEISAIRNDLASVSSLNLADLKKAIAEDDAKIKKNSEISAKASELRASVNSKLKEKETVARELSNVRETKARAESSIESSKRNLVEVSDDEFRMAYEDSVNVDEVAEEFSKLSEILDSVKSEGVKVNAMIDGKNAEIQKTTELFNHSKECPVCHSELTEKALVSYVEKIQSEVDELSKRRDALRADYSKKSAEAKSMKASYDATVRIRKNRQIEKDVAEKEKQVKTLLENMKELETVLSEIQKEIDVVETQAKSLESSIEKTLASYERSDIERKIETVSDVSSKTERLNSLEKEYAKLGSIPVQDSVNAISEENSKSDSVKFQYGKLVSAIESEAKSKNRMEEIISSIEKVKQDIKEYERLRAYFGKNGIQKEQIEHILKSVEMETNGMVNKFFDNIGVKFVYDGSGIGLEIIRQTVSDDGIEYKPDVLKNFSDAQQEVLKTLLKLSFSKVLQYLNGTPLNVIFLNETFNTLSVEKEDDLVGILRYFAEEYHVFFITHNQSIISKYGSDSIVRL